jgi:hypothetical protein
VSRIFFGDPKAIEDELATAVADDRSIGAKIAQATQAQVSPD